MWILFSRYDFAGVNSIHSCIVVQASPHCYDNDNNMHYKWIEETV